jgi:hypothetical protein
LGHFGPGTYIDSGSFGIQVKQTSFYAPQFPTEDTIFSFPMKAGEVWDLEATLFLNHIEPNMYNMHVSGSRGNPLDSKVFTYIVDPVVGAGVFEGGVLNINYGFSAIDAITTNVSGLGIINGTISPSVDENLLVNISTSTSGQHSFLRGSYAIARRVY